MKIPPPPHAVPGVEPGGPRPERDCVRAYFLGQDGNQHLRGGEDRHRSQAVRSLRRGGALCGAVGAPRVAGGCTETGWVRSGKRHLNTALW